MSSRPARSVSRVVEPIGPDSYVQLESGKIRRIPNARDVQEDQATLRNQYAAQQAAARAQAAAAPPAPPSVLASNNALTKYSHDDFHDQVLRVGTVVWCRRRGFYDAKIKPGSNCFIEITKITQSGILKGIRRKSGDRESGTFTYEERINQEVVQISTRFSIRWAGEIGKEERRRIPVDGGPSDWLRMHQ